MSYDKNSFLQGIAVGRSMKGISGGGAGVSPKQVNFIDYDGTLLYSYTVQEANALTSLPDNPSHSGLIAQGWNWTLAQIKAQLTAMPDGPVWVGQMYVTQSGDTEIDVSMPEGRLSPVLTIAVNGEVTVDWGDNTTADSVTGSSLTTDLEVLHTYTSSGNYTIKIHVVSGSFAFYTALMKKNIVQSPTVQNQNLVYANCVTAVRIGSGVTSIGGSAFYTCHSLAYVTIPIGVTSIGNGAFTSCYSLASVTIPSGATIGNNVFSYCPNLSCVTIPSGVTSIGSSMFYNCYGLASVTIPNGVTSIGGMAFNNCYNLASVTIPSTVTSIDDQAFYSCYSIAPITIPNGVSSIKYNTFSYCRGLATITIPSSVTSIENNAFAYCYSLASVTIPSGVTSIGDNAFSGCQGVAEYHIKPTAPPSLGQSVFSGIVSDCVIYVPSAQLADYQSANRWSAYASYMQGE